jgi:hypothetical protein
MRTCSWLIALCVAACLHLAGEAVAQQNPLVGGIWRTDGYTTGGVFIGNYSFSFGADGTFHQRLVTSARLGKPGGTTDYFGRYSLSSDERTLQLIYLDYEPKQICAQGTCYPAPASTRLNTPLSTRIVMISANEMQTLDASGALGALLWVRQPQ